MFLALIRFRSETFSASRRSIRLYDRDKALFLATFGPFDFPDDFLLADSALVLAIDGCGHGLERVDLDVDGVSLVLGRLGSLTIRRGGRLVISSESGADSESDS